MWHSNTLIKKKTRCLWFKIIHELDVQQVRDTPFTQPKQRWTYKSSLESHSVFTLSVGLLSPPIPL